MLQPNAAAAVPVEANIKLTENTFLLGYRIRNMHPAPILLFNVLWELRDSNHVKAPVPAYVCVRGEELHVAHQILPAPKRKQVPLRVVPFATRVAAGAEHVARLEFPLPVQEYSCYYGDNARATKQRITVKSVVFTLQYVVETPDVKTHPAPINGALRVEHPKLFTLVETVHSAPIRAEIPVDERTDPFEEF